MSRRKKTQVTGYKYFCSLVGVLGNPIDRVLGYRFGDKGKIVCTKKRQEWGEKYYDGREDFDISHQQSNDDGILYGRLSVYNGTKTQNADPEYNQYLARNNLPPLAFRNLSYVILKDFCWGKNPYLTDISFMASRIFYSKGYHNGQWNKEYARVFSWQYSSYILQKDDITYTVSWNDKNGQQQTINNLRFMYNSWLEDGIYIDRITSSFKVKFQCTVLKTGILYMGFYFNGGIIKNINSSKHIIKRINHTDGQYYLTDSSNIMLSVLQHENIEIEVEYQVNYIGYLKIFIDEKQEELFYIQHHQYLYDKYIDKYGKNYPTAFYDLNPVHKIREILTEDTAMNKPESDLNEKNFLETAKIIYQEKLGISWAVQDKSCKEALDELCHHIEAGLRVNRQTGKYEIILFRDELTQQQINNALHFNEQNIKQFYVDIQQRDEMVNMLNVKYYDREQMKMSSFSISDIGLIHTLGYENAKDIEFPYFMNRRNAEKVAHWKLKQLSTPKWTGSITTGIHQARSLNRYDVILLSWANLNIKKLPVRVMKINLGDGVNNTVTIDFVEVIDFSSIEMPISQHININNQLQKPKIAQARLFEMPYLEAIQQYNESLVNLELKNDPDLAYLMVACQRPQANSSHALLYSNSANKYEKTGYVSYCPTVTLNQDIDYLTTTFNVKNIENLQDIERGSLILIDDEFMIYQSYNNNQLTAKRGALDTQPQKHSIDSILYFCDEYSGLDNTKYTNQEFVKVKILTVAGNTMLDIEQAPELSIKLQGRLYRPYPPANVKINGYYYPTSPQYQLSLNWSNRNRLMQTGGELLSWIDGNTAIEDGVTYLINIYQISKNNIETLLVSENIQQNTSYKLNQLKTKSDTVKYRIELFSVRENLKCMYPFNYIVDLDFYAPFDVNIMPEQKSNKINWSVENNNFDNILIYRDTQPINIDNLPTPIARLSINDNSYIDNNLSHQSYYYRIASVKNSEILLSDEIFFTNN